MFGFCGLCGGDQQIDFVVTSPAPGTVFHDEPVVIEYVVDGTEGGAYATAMGPGSQVVHMIPDGASSGSFEFLPATNSGPITIEISAENSDHYDDENDYVMVEWIAPWEASPWRRSFQGCDDPSCFAQVNDGDGLSGTTTLLGTPTYDVSRLDRTEVRLDGVVVPDLDTAADTVTIDTSAHANGPVEVTAALIRDDDEVAETTFSMTISN